VAVFAAGAVAVKYSNRARPQALDSSASVPTSAATVTRGTVTERAQIAGTLGYDGSYTVVNRMSPGVVTAVSEPGSTVGRGGVLYAVADQPVRMLFGAVPAYRDFNAAMSDGPDVRQLEQNLVALGLDPHRRITVDNRFTTATAAAIRRWQAAWGWPVSRRSGEVGQGEVVFLPGAIRVSQVQASVGTQVDANTPVLSATSTDRVVTAQLTTDRQNQVKVNDRVLVSVVGAAQVPGRVLRIGAVAAASSGGSGTAGSGSDGSSGSGSTADGGSGPGAATIPVTIGITVPPAVADLDSAPAQVIIATASHQGVLMVPVSALLARAGGGYQIRLAEGGFVEVRPGLFDEATGLVEVSGDSLVEGLRVEVPVS
jgi:hypothetical protein